MKKIFILFCTFSLFLGMVYSQQVSVIINAPANANPNEEFKIDISIQKGDVSGFARLQVDFPEGFTVSSSETNGATFSYRENKARFLWMSLPADNTLKVSCLVKANTEGAHEFEGSFSYVLDNETQRSIIPAQIITIGKPDLAVAVIKDIPKKEDEGIAVRSEAERLEAERKAREEAERKVREEAEHKARLEAEAKAEAERKAKEEDVRKAEQIIDEQEKDKEIVVVEVPVEIFDIEKPDEVEAVSHEIVVVEIPTSDDSEKIEAERKAREEAIAKAEKERIARETAARAEEERRAKERIEAERLAKEKVEQERLARETAERRTREDLERRTVSSEATPVQRAVAGKVEFRVQVGASRQPAEAGHYRRLDSNISEFNVVRNDGNDGWYRYTIGSFTTVEATQQLLGRVKQLGFDGFVAAFKDGQRTTIAEAKRLLGQ